MAGERQVLCPVAPPQLRIGSSPKVAFTKKGFRGERRSPDSSTVLQRYQLSIRHLQGSHSWFRRQPRGRWSVSSHLQAWGNAQEERCVWRSRSYDLFRSMEILETFLLRICALFPPLFGNCTSYLETLLWPPFWVIIYSLYGSSAVHY